MTWRSAPGGSRKLRWTDWFVAASLVWLTPVILGLFFLILAHALSTALALDASGATINPLLPLFFMGYVFLFSPLLSWAGMAIAIGPAWLLLHKGWGGWGSFCLLGLVSGALAAALFDGFLNAFGGVFGLIAALAFRWILFRLKPEIFTAR